MIERKWNELWAKQNVFINNTGLDIWNKVKKSSKIRQGQENLTNVTKVLCLEMRQGL